MRQDKEIDMKKYLVLFVSALLLFGVSEVRAEQSSIGGDALAAQQVFQTFRNATGGDISSNTVVILSTSTQVTAGFGSRFASSTVTGARGVIGVTDEDIASGRQGRICIRGPHKVIAVQPLPSYGATLITASASPGAVVAISNSIVSTIPQASGGISTVGYRIGSSTNTQLTGNDIITIWVSPGQFVD